MKRMKKIIECVFRSDIQNAGVRVAEVISPADPGIYLVRWKLVSVISSAAPGTQIYNAGLHYGNGGNPIQETADLNDPVTIQTNADTRSTQVPFQIISGMGEPVGYARHFGQIHYADVVDGLYLHIQRIADTADLHASPDRLVFEFQINKLPE